MSFKTLATRFFSPRRPAPQAQQPSHQLQWLSRGVIDAADASSPSSPTSPTEYLGLFVTPKLLFAVALWRAPNWAGGLEASMFGEIYYASARNGKATVSPGAHAVLSAWPKNYMVKEEAVKFTILPTADGFTWHTHKVQAFFEEMLVAKAHCSPLEATLDASEMLDVLSTFPPPDESTVSAIELTGQFAVAEHFHRAVARVEEEMR